MKEKYTINKNLENNKKIQMWDIIYLFLIHIYIILTSLHKG